MKKVFNIKKTCLHFLILLSIIALHSPVYHQHVDNHHPKPLKHIDNIASHVHNDDFVNSYETKLEPQVFTEEPHDTHYHSHLEKDLYRTHQIETNKVKPISVYTFNNLPTHSLVLKKQLYDYYKPKHYSRNYAKTSSGLSPPRFSV